VSDFDLAPYQAAGLYDPADEAAADRAELLAFLVEIGCTIEEMTAAHGRGRLFALAGDRIIRPERDRYTLAEVAAQVGADEDVVRRAWRAFGLALRDPGDRVASPDDVEAVRTHVGLVAFFGEDAALSLARVTASALSRLGEALSSTVRTASTNLDLDIHESGSEITTARAFAGAASAVPAAGRMIDTIYRHHIESARMLFEQAVEAHPDRQIAMGIGFVDLCDFTALSGRLDSAKLAHLLTRFEEIATEVATDCGSRAVKFIGDAVMFVAPNPVTVVHTAVSLMNHPEASTSGLSARGGVAFGPVLAQDGDFFGPPVNLASRLCSAAKPETLLVADDLVERIDGRWPLESVGALTLRGIDAPVAASALRICMDETAEGAPAVGW
jgi:class 3 adenylate cyclase